MKLLNNVFTTLVVFALSQSWPVAKSYAQMPEFDWASQVSGFSPVWGEAISSDYQGYSETACRFNDSLTITHSQGEFTMLAATSNSPFAYKLNELGEFQWAMNLDVAISSLPTDRNITSDQYGNVYMAITVSSFPNWDIDPGGDSIVLSLVNDAVIAKFSSQGEVHWAKAIADNSLWPQEPRDIAVDSEGNVYSCGRFEGAPDFDPGPDTLIIADVGAGSGFIHKMNSDGELLWAGRIGEVGSAQGLVIDSLDNVYVTGYYQDTVDISPGPDTLIMGGVTGNLEGYVIKLNPDGLTEWATGIGGSGGEIANSIALSPNGDILVSGTFNDTVNSYPQLLDEPLQTAGDYDIFIWKLDMDGGSIEAHRIGGPVIDGGYAIVNPTTKIKTDALGNVYLRGTINHGYPLFNIDLDPGPDTAWSQDLGITHEFIAKYDPNMSLIWAMPGNGAADFAVGNGQELYLTGTFTDTIDLDPGPLQQLYISEGGSDMYVVKLNQDSLLTTNGEKGMPGRMGGENGLAVRVFPNPSAGSFTVDLSSENSDVRYQISDLAGRGVQTESGQSSRFTIELESEPGVYLLRLWNEDEWTVVRVVKE